MKTFLAVSVIILGSAAPATGYAFVGSRNARTFQGRPSTQAASYSSSSSSLKMVDQQILMGAGIAIAGLAVGVGMVAFTENQGERAKERGAGLSENMSQRIAGGLLEDVEVSSVEDLGSLTSQLEQALKETAGEDQVKDIEMTEEEKKRIKEEADDGW